MSRKRHKPEEIVAKLRQVDVLVAQGTPVADAIRSIGVTEVASGRAPGWGGLLQLTGGSDHHRELATALQHGSAARVVGYRPQLRRCLCPPSPPGRLRHPDRLRRPGTP